MDTKPFAIWIHRTTPRLGQASTIAALRPARWPANSDYLEICVPGNNIRATSGSSGRISDTGNLARGFTRFDNQASLLPPTIAANVEGSGK
jgi:hypothetical protein